MLTWKEITQVVSEDGNRRMTIWLIPTDRFRFIEDTRVHEDDDMYWHPSHTSGVYPSAEEAECVARLELPWLRDRNSN